MDKPSLKHTDLILGLDVKDWEKQLTELNNAKRIREVLPPDNCDYVEIGFAEVGISKWRWTIADATLLGSGARRHHNRIPELTRLCRERIGADPSCKRRSPTGRSRSASATTRSGRNGRRIP